MKRLNETFPQWVSGEGIFSLLNQKDVPWKSFIDPLSLDLEYFGNFSGEKICSPLTEKLFETESDYGEILSSLIFNRYKNEWNRLYENLITLTYNPIYNYNMIENGENVENSSREEDVSRETSTNTVNKESGSTVTESEISGFDSSVYSPERMETITPNIEESTNTGSDITQHLDFLGDRTETHKLTREGNIGVTTTQQMLESEIELRLKYNFFPIVFKNLDEILTCPIY